MNSKLNYKCLILDHDDTIVNSTSTIHYPAFLETLQVMRPNFKISLEEFINYCFEPGFFQLIREILKLTPEEEQQQYNIWKKYSNKQIPALFTGVKDFLTEFKQRGGLIGVISHSETALIKRDYQHHLGFVPNVIFDSNIDQEKRKPAPYPLLKILNQFQLLPHEAIVVDDLKAGLEMAKACKVSFAFSYWGQQVKQIRKYMSQHADFNPKTVTELKSIVFRTY